MQERPALDCDSHFPICTYETFIFRIKTVGMYWAVQCTSPPTSRFPSAFEMSLGVFPQTSLGPSEILRSKGMYNSIHPDSRQCMDTMFSARGCVSDIHPRAIFPDALPGEQGVYWMIRSLEIISFYISLVSSEPMINASLIMMRECMARQDMASCRGYMASSSKLLGGSACRESPSQHIAP